MEIREIVIEQIKLYNETLDTPIDLTAGDDSALFGKNGVLDSLDFVSLVMDIEQAVENETGRHVTLADEKALSEKNSPFRTVGTLVEYIERVMR